MLISSDGCPPIILLINRSCKANEGIAKVFLPLLISNVVFYLPEGLIDFFEALDERGVNVELKIVLCGFQRFQLFFDIVQSSAFEVLGFDLEDGDLVNELTKRDRGKDILDRFCFDSRLGELVLVRRVH